MIISRTPYRISFLGGGSDFPVWYNEHGGAVLSTSINKYCYIFCRWLPPFFEHRHRIVWSQIELAQRISEIIHPTVRESLKFLSITDGVEIHHAGDLPHMSGMGTSSAFTVGLLHALYSLLGVKVSKLRLAQESIYIEQDLCHELVGSQDQTAASYGGFNRIDFSSDSIKVTPIRSSRLSILEERLMLFFTGFQRNAAEIEGEKLKNISSKQSDFSALCALVDDGEAILNGSASLEEFGKLLHEGWIIKRSMSDKTSTDYIDFLYQKALEAGAIGGKILGAGGGGFLLLFVEPEVQKRVSASLKLLHVPFRFEREGSTIIYQGS